MLAIRLPECALRFGQLVNQLFQPSITFDKSVDAHLSKVGDGVTYTLTLNNTSSADTPDLVCTINDPTLGINKNVTLASGASDVTTKAYTFQVGEPRSVYEHGQRIVLTDWVPECVD